MGSGSLRGHPGMGGLVISRRRLSGYSERERRRAAPGRSFPRMSLSAAIRGLRVKVGGAELPATRVVSVPAAIVAILALPPGVLFPSMVAPI
jgi:hypothetical protein